MSFLKSQIKQARLNKIHLRAAVTKRLRKQTRRLRRLAKKD
jgi:hypothetical protein